MDQWEPDAAKELISQVIRDRAIFPVFQPIRDLTTGALVAVEALARGPAGSAVESAPALFAAARAAGQLSRVDQLAFTRAIETARDSPRPLPLLFANAEPAVLNEPPSVELMDAVHAPRPFRIVMEYTERALGSEPAGSVSIARLAYAEGNAIAMDDVGADPQSLAFIPLFEPDVIKFDLSLMRHPRSPRAVETVTAVGAYIERTGAVVVAEGIETEEDIVKAHGFGARWGQGWLLGKPGPLDDLVELPSYEGEGLRRPPGPETYLPESSPFDIAAMQGQIRPADQRAIEDLTDYLLSMAASADPNTVVLGAYEDQGRAGGVRSAPGSHAPHRRLRRIHRTDVAPRSEARRREPPRRRLTAGCRGHDAGRRRSIRRVGDVHTMGSRRISPSDHHARPRPRRFHRARPRPRPTLEFGGRVIPPNREGIDVGRR